MHCSEQKNRDILQATTTDTCKAKTIPLINLKILNFRYFSHSEMYSLWPSQYNHHTDTLCPTLCAGKTNK